MRNQKGQESAPFEILVAVVILGFVLYMAAQAIEFVTLQQSKAQMRDQMSTLKQAVQNAHNGNSSSVVFSPQITFKKPKELLFKVYAQQSRCSQLCSKVFSECLVFSFRSETFSEDQCIEGVPTYANFSPSTNCSDRDGYDLINFKEGILKDLGDNQTGRFIPNGSYLIINKTLGAGSTPIFCVYLKN